MGGQTRLNLKHVQRPGWISSEKKIKEREKMGLKCRLRRGSHEGKWNPTRKWQSDINGEDKIGNCLGSAEM